MQKTSKWWWSNLKELSAYCWTYFPKDVEEIMQQANRICENTFLFTAKWEMERTHVPVTFPTQVDWEYIPDGDPEWVYALNRLTCLLSLAQAFALSGNERFVYKFNELMIDWVDSAQLTEKSTQTTWRTLEAGLRCENLLKSYFCIEESSAFSIIAKEKLFSSLRQHAEYLFSVNDDFRLLSNWGVLQNHGLFLLGVFFEDNRYIECALRRLMCELELQVLPDGVHWEQSPMYHCEVLHCFLDTLTIARRNGISLPHGMEDIVHRMSLALAFWCKPNGYMPCQSDSDEMNVQDLLTYAAVLFNDGILKAVAGSCYYAENLWNLGVAGALAYEKLPITFPKCSSSAMIESGNYILRSSFNQKANYLHFHCGSLGSGHGHADLLHIDLASQGEDILIDPGRYTYVDTPIRRQLKLPASHNTIRVDHQNFSECAGAWGYSKLAMPVKGECRFGKTAEFVSGGHLGYLSLSNDSVFVNRKIVWIKPNIYLLVDEFYGRCQHTYEQYFHFNNHGEVCLCPNAAVYHGENVQAQFLFLTKNVYSKLMNTQMSRQYNQIEESFSIQNTLTGKGFCSMITVISLSDSDSQQNLSAEIIPVVSAKSKKVYLPEEAEAVKITQNGQETIIIVCHQEIISEVDFLCADKCKGYGKVIVFTPWNSDGECLQW